MFIYGLQVLHNKLYLLILLKKNIFHFISFSADKLFPLSWKWCRILWKYGMNSDTSSRFIGSKFDIHLIVLSSAAWLAHEMHSDTIPIFSAKGFETQEFVAQLLPMMLTGCTFQAEAVFRDQSCWANLKNRVEIDTGIILSDIVIAVQAVL